MPKARQKKQKKQEVILTPEEKFEQLTTLMRATGCLLKVEDKYQIYKKLVRDFAELGKTAEKTPFEGSEQCAELGAECEEIARGLEKNLPDKPQEESRTVMTTAREKEAEEKRLGEKKGSLTKRIAIVAVILIAAGVFAYRLSAVRYAVAGAAKGLGLNKYAMDVYEELSGYQDSDDKYREAAYAYAGGLEADGQDKQARELYGELDGYQDSAQKELALEKKLIEKADVGKTVVFGSADWIVLDKEGGNAFLVKKGVIEDGLYHSGGKSVTWKDCSLRDYLNDKFLRETFTEQEQEAIVPVELANADNDRYKTAGGEKTTDRVYLPAREDIEKYGDIMGKKKNGIRIREPGITAESTAYTSGGGEIVDYGFPVEKRGMGVRPCLRVNYR